MKNIIFIAAPATGKGTLSNMLMERYDYTHISTGDLLRNAIASNSNLGKEIANIMSKGLLISDEIMFDVIKDAIIHLDKDKPFILDGLPREVNQAIYIDKLFEELKITDYKVIYLNIDYEVALKRALGRLNCPKCKASYNKFFEDFKPQKENICDKCESVLVSRTDDNEISFKHRFENYRKYTLPLVDYYEKSDKLIKINTQEFTNEQIFDIIIKAVK